MWCACWRISPAGAEEVWRWGVCGENTGEEILPSKTLFAEKGKERFCLAEQVGFEPTGLERLTDFESASL